MKKQLENKPLIITVFGGTGDLAQNKIFSALFDLSRKGLLPDKYKIVGFARRPLSNEDYRQFVYDSLQTHGRNENTSEFLKNVFYTSGDINTTSSYDDLRNKLNKLDEEDGLCSNRIFYLAVPPHLYEPVFINIEKADLVKPCDNPDHKNWTRVLVEKPFGENPEKALSLDKLLGRLFDEDQIFRIDHYLAKEALQNIITFRFANAIFEPIWSNRLIQKVEINLYEEGGVETRGAFYDPIGALRDVGQNHVLQMLALIAMDDPQGMTAEKIRAARLAVLKKVAPYGRNSEDYVRIAQYEGYKNIDGVAPNSQTETFFEMKLQVKNRRWKNVPFYISSGKALGQKRAEIKIVFRATDSHVCPVDDVCEYGNTITIEIQPEEKISVCFWKKTADLEFALEEKKLSFNYADDMSNKMLPDAYEKVLYDCLIGDQTLFPSTEEIFAQWAVIDKMKCAGEKCGLGSYKPGTDPEKLKTLK